MVMTTSSHGRDLIRRWEGTKLVSYQDVAGIWTIGTGHTRTAKPGMSITSQQADELLRQDLLEAEKSVLRLVTAPMLQNEFDALASFTFNCGAGALGQSTLLKLFNAGDKMNAALNFVPWSKATVGGKLVPVTGLILRRCDETRVFLGA